MSERKCNTADTQERIGNHDTQQLTVECLHSGQSTRACR
jgi:hypothetical protein